MYCIDRRRIALAGPLLMLSACSTRRGTPSGMSTGPAWDAYRIGVGRRIVAANPDGTYTGPVPEPLLAIPVLEIDLNRDGSVRSMRVQRTPTQAEDTVKLAMEAVRRAGPFGDVSHLQPPWRFSEVFLFRDDRRFKPRSLDQ